MKLKNLYFLLALSAIWSLQSCDNNDDESLNVPVRVTECLIIQIPECNECNECKMGK